MKVKELPETFDECIKLLHARPERQFGPAIRDRIIVNPFTQETKELPDELREASNEGAGHA